MMTTNNTNLINRNIGLYIHLPFCQRKCSYCGFLSLAGQSGAVIQNYMDNLLVEASLQIADLDTREDENRTRYHLVDTIYIGGGTPSLIDGQQMLKLMDGIRDKWTVSDKCEITMECNPNSLTPENLTAYRKAGVNRLSIGVQSFDDSILEGLGRLHDARTARDAYATALIAGFDNINLDLMFGLPGQTLQQWKDTLKAAISLSPTHLSLYTLQIEEGTRLYHEYKSEKLPEVDLTVDRACYHYAIDYLKRNGYNQYEISNFAKDGYECKHNCKYWSMDNYLGLGLNASSYLDGKRWRNLSELDLWKGQLQTGMLPIDQTTLKQDSIKDAMGIFLFTGLRKNEGISFLEFAHRFGTDFFKVYSGQVDQLNQYRKQGYLDWSDTQTGRLWITESGIDHSNEILSEFV